MGNKAQQEFSILFSDIIMKYALCHKRNILKIRVSNYKQENFLLYIGIVYYFTTILSQQKVGCK